MKIKLLKGTQQRFKKTANQKISIAEKDKDRPFYNGPITYYFKNNIFVHQVYY